MSGWMSESSMVVAADYSGLGVGQMTALRAALREKGLEFKVVKNTLAYLAADAAERPAMKEIIQGPTGVAIGYGDPSEPAKALAEFIRENRSNLTIRGGVMGKAILTAAEVNRLATLPSREELIARLLGQLQAPVGGLVNVLNGPIAGLARVLQRRVETVEA